MSWNSLSKTVARQLEAMIETGELSRHQRLPSERQLAARFEVSRTSVREALSLLEASGKLHTQPGRGSFWNDLSNYINVQEAPESGPGFIEVSRKTYPKNEISRFRYLLEGQAARLAAMKITDKQIEQLEKNLQKFKSQTRLRNLAESARTDFEFHQLILQFSGVTLFADLHSAFRDVIMQAVRMYSAQYNRAWEPVSEHEKILEALKRRDPDEALYYSHSHILRSADRLGISNTDEII